jgi:hypothetical protein
LRVGLALPRLRPLGALAKSAFTRTLADVRDAVFDFAPNPQAPNGRDR